MKLLKGIVYTVLAVMLVGGIYLYSKASNLEDPEFLRLENVKFKNVNLSPKLSLTFTSNAIFNNPNEEEFTISKVEFDVFVDGKETTHFVQKVEAEMIGNSEFSLPLDFEVPINNKDYLQNLKEIASGAWKNRAVNIRTKGWVTLRAGRVQLDVDFDYDDDYSLEDYL